ncbi:MAG: nucleotidyltransferase domain-containing protein [Acidimicrobiales bacterium]|nr:nucleotidyltransferase domain-containing protein [Acidimicrobiales bacterium]
MAESQRPLRALVETHRHEIKAAVARHRGASATVFGSVARGDESPQSDVDFLVEFQPGASLFDLARLELELQELLGVGVDVVSAGSLLPEDEDVRAQAVAL